jgi:hypothetical protein
MTQAVSHVVVTAPIAQWKLDEILPLAANVHYHPDNKVPDDVLQKAEVWFTTWTGFPPNVTQLDQIPNTRIIQLTSGESWIGAMADIQLALITSWTRR